MKKKELDYNRCPKCGIVPVHNPLTCMNKCPNCGFKWTDTYAENTLWLFWNRPVKVQFT